MLLCLVLASIACARGSLDAACGHLVVGEVDAKVWAGQLSLKEVRDLIPKGEVVCAKALVNHPDTSREVTSTLAAEARLALRAADREEQQLLARLTGPSYLKSPEKDISRLSPALEWAQSASRIFLRIKWAHKLDAPATLDVGRPVIECKDTLVSVKASSATKFFELNLRTYAAIAQNCSWESGAVGRITLTLEKKLTPARWPNLGTTSGPAHLWFDKQEDYTNELEKLESAETPAADTKKTKSKKKTNKKKTSAKKESSSIQSSDDTDAVPKKEETIRSGKKSFLPQSVYLDAIFDTFKKKLIQPITINWNHFTTNYTAGVFLLDTGYAILNALDGWTGDPVDFLNRQAERAQARVQRNATRIIHQLQADLAKKKHEINKDLRAQIAALSAAKNKSNASLASPDAVAEDPSISSEEEDDEEEAISSTVAEQS